MLLKRDLWRFGIVVSILLLTVGLAPRIPSFGGLEPLLAQSAIPPLPAPAIVITEDSRLNMRQGPGVDFPLVLKLDPQTEVTVIAALEDGSWVELEVEGVGNGWVATEWIRFADIGEATDGGLILVPTPTPTSARMGIAALLQPGGVLRTTENGESNDPVDEAETAVSSPSTESEDIAAADITERGTTTNTVTGAINSADNNNADDSSDAVFDLATETPAAEEATSADDPEAEVVVDDEDVATPTPTATPVPTTEATAEPTAEPEVPTAISQPERMNVRGGPGTTFPVVGGIDGGTALEILGVSPAQDWYLVEFDGTAEQAWVFSGLMQVVGPVDQIRIVPEEELPVAPTPAPEPEANASVSGSTVSLSASAAPPPAGGGFFGYGVQAHMLGGGVGEAMNATSEMGFNWIKQQVEWRIFQSQPGPIATGELAGIINAAGQRNINVLFSVVNAPDWAREPGFDASVGGPPADPATYASFVGGLAGQFCGTALKAIEIWNEQNLHYEWGNKPLDPVEYMNLLRAAYGSIKAACPEMLVISGALTPAGSNPPFARDDFAYLEAMYQNGLAAVSDGIGAHPSGYNVPASVRWEQACEVIQQTGNSFNGACDTPHHSWSFRSTMEGYRNIMVVYGDTNKRIWPTEFGWAAGGAFDPRYAYANDNSFDEQAAWTVEAFTMMRDWGWVGPAFLWNLNFRVVADGTEKAQWGIVGNDYSPLPVYHALRDMPK